MFALLATRRFGPLFATQFLGAFNDNLFKTGLIFLVAFHLRAGDPVAAATLATVAAGVFIVPFVLFSGIAGEVADARDKAMIARGVKIAEIAFMALGALALAIESVPLALVVVFLMGAHSTIFGPVKYAILPQHLAPGELLAGTGLVEGATFVAILLGQIAGGLLPTGWVGPVAIAVALVGWLASRAIPTAPPASRVAIDWNPLTASRRALSEAFGHRELAIATLCISWFWALGAVYTSQFVPLARNDLGGSEGVATLFLAAFSIGVAIGSAGVGRLLGGRVSTRLSPWAGLVMALAGIDLWFAERALHGSAGDIATFLADPRGWRVLADLTILAIAGGIFSVPLYGILQTATDPASRSRAIAANNIVNAGFQVTAVLGIGVAISHGVSVPTALVGAGLTVVLLIPMLRKLPR
ncbi:MFS transporter [Polymorphobacter fuscus]|uniref:MFS transporter n=1 Tax=Sandarakinorhabdus fusca TaxID=1439888 RepID=A0A7C9KHV3_9SPHN|nr:MFS transporter [Polymorphobacter fuscus]KAB7647521.1 MFS transporter [Polymorphobacter fuscus]MQT16781.1 MFS transporter [Polymorphobacter fuscus]NJC09231.1 acyl-[acyl-carrier-protein]-phospholipid O-acyltransferase/long-chain-fatty-acid--[acyl-carrier-protein] ligase [Polymorphobacter fuscus]